MQASFGQNSKNVVFGPDFEKDLLIMCCPDVWDQIWWWPCIGDTRRNPITTTFQTNDLGTQTTVALCCQPIIQSLSKLRV